MAEQKMSHGFSLVEERYIEELSSRARVWKHAKSGAELLSLCNADENKVFGVSFRTPPKNSTGVAHILEHSVLCGSKKYPVKEPFVELLKGSLQTFLNAFTYPDKTCYPVASTNLADFYNLIDVYLDAVFYPCISKEIFQQEGWHYECKDDGSLEYKGVVFNEMKGAYSAPESVLGEETQHSIFPDTTYGLDSGGNPANIPDLSYEEFKEFHARYYHPSNGRFYFWGDDDEEARLALLDKVLEHFDAISVDSAVPLQGAFSAPRRVEAFYAAGADAEGVEEIGADAGEYDDDDVEDTENYVEECDACADNEPENEGAGESVESASSSENSAAKAMMTVNWLLPETKDAECNFALQMLEHILIELPASPLRKALIESGYGEDLAGSGLECELRQMYFSVGLKGMRPENEGAVQELILRTLQGLADAGIAKESIEAAVNSVEFDLRENNTGRFPVGLAVMTRALTTWLYGEDPMTPIAFEAPLGAIKARLAKGEPVFEELIRRYFLENQHRTTVLVLPSQSLDATRREAETARLAAVRAAMDDAEFDAVKAQMERIHARQTTPDSAEALASIPQLGVGDLPLTNKLIPSERAALTPAVPVLWHDIDTKGILYTDAAFSLGAVPESLLPLVPLWGRTLTEMGTTQRNFVDLSMRIARKTGGIDSETLFLSPLHAPQNTVAHVLVQGKATQDKTAELFALLAEILLQPNFDDRERFRSIVLEEKARLEHSFVPSGHVYVMSRLKARYTQSGMLGELCGGFSALEYLRNLAVRVENSWDSVLAELQQLHTLIIRNNAALVNLTASAQLYAEAKPLAEQLAAALPTNDSADASGAWQSHLPAENEALILPAQVNYVGKALNLGAVGYKYTGAASVILKHLRMGYLWDNVRVLGGAYGAFCTLDRATGVFSQVSYRDPNVLETVGIFDKSAEYLRTLELDKDALATSIVGAMGDMDTHLLPDAKGMAALARHFAGDTDEKRQVLREEILHTSMKDFHEFGEALAEAQKQPTCICVLGGAKAEECAKEQGWKSIKTL